MKAEKKKQRKFSLMEMASFSLIPQRRKKAAIRRKDCMYLVKCKFASIPHPCCPAKRRKHK